MDVVTPGPRFNFDVQTDADCITMYRFRKEDIRRLAVLLQLPATTTSRNRTTWSAEEGLCIVLRWLAYPCRLTDLVHIFGRWMPELSVIVNTVCQQICSTWMHLLTDFTHSAWFALARFTHKLSTTRLLCPTALVSLMVQCGPFAGPQWGRGPSTMATRGTMA